ncbi:MAG: UvrB/UvrC motif-containing protein [candidate division WOR-3 bacterium]|nr:UvrB/UvrC motif-containing protein [candidate division WOR-3 bacterium]
MLCDNCKKNPATFFYKDVSGEQIKEVHLCEECARKKGIISDKKLSPHEILQKLLKSVEKEDGQIVCPICLLTLSEFKKFGRFGCANCLKVFEPYIKTLIREVQNSEKHIGKKAKPGGRRIVEIFRLKEELRRALEKEAYEDAAKIRDQLKTMGVENV